MWKPVVNLEVERAIRRVIKLLLNSSAASKTTNEIFDELPSYSDTVLSSALAEARNRGILACSNKRWWIRQRRLANETLFEKCLYEANGKVCELEKFHEGKHKENVHNVRNR